MAWMWESGHMPKVTAEKWQSWNLNAGRLQSPQPRLLSKQPDLPTSPSGLQAPRGSISCHFILIQEFTLSVGGNHFTILSSIKCHGIFLKAVSFKAPAWSCRQHSSCGPAWPRPCRALQPSPAVLCALRSRTLLTRAAETPLILRKPLPVPGGPASRG